MRVAADPAFANRRGNPYQALLYTELQAMGVEVEELTLASLRGRPVDAVHVHWPESCMNAATTRAALRRAARTLGKQALARARGVPVVWTVHNLATHEQRHPRLERWFWRAFVPLVSAQISHSPGARQLAVHRFPRLARLPGRVVPHGHWRGVYGEPADRVEARLRLGVPADVDVLAFVGRIKPYKGVEDLVAAFRGWDADCLLLVAGNIDDPARRDRLVAAARGDERIRLHLDGVADEDLRWWFAAADALVCPYRAILNSASAILALSFDRPVLVPAIGALPELAAEAGPTWVRTYRPGELGPAALAAALDAGRAARGALPPTLAGREWRDVALGVHDLLREVTGSG